MNSCYGKFALSIVREVINELTTNEETIIEMMEAGLITKFEEIDINGKTFYEFSGM